MSGRRLIVGAGALGALLAAQWRAAGVPAVLVARGAALEVIRERGVTIRRPHGDETIDVDVVDAIDAAEPADGDSVVLAVKAQDAEQALASLAWRALATGGAVADLPVVTLQNGLSAETIASRRSAAVVGVSVGIAASHLRPGEVVSPSWPTIGVARAGAATVTGAPFVEAVREDLARAGFAASVVDDIAATKRRKLLGNLRNVVEVFDVDAAEREAATDALRREAEALFARLDLAGARVAQQAQLLGVLEQQLPRAGGLERAAAHDEHRAHLRLQRAQALRHGGLGHVQALGGALKAALLHDGGKAFEGGGVVSAHG